MHTYLALLRGINVGGNNKVSMSELKKIFESLDFTQVFTYINSGNVIFQTSAQVVTEKIELALKKTLGFEIRVVVRDAKNIQKLCSEIPLRWKNDTEHKTDVLFLWPEFAHKKSIGLITATEVDTLTYLDGAIVWHIDKKNYNKSGLHKFIGTHLYKNMTARNINTVRKLGELMKK